MPLRFAAHLRRQPLAALLLAGLIVLQALLAGLASAQPVHVLTGGLGDLAIFCHGHGAADPGSGPPPEPDKSQHPCCLACPPGAAPAVLGGSAVALGAECSRPSEPTPRGADAILITPRAVRAGFSQAPPRPV